MKTNNRQRMNSTRVFTHIVGRSRSGLVSLIIILTALEGFQAQSIDRSASSCPRVTVTGGSRETLQFEAIVTGESPGQNFSYHWSIYNGQITEGQGTPAIKVKTDSDSLTVRVELKGLPAACGSVDASMSLLHLVGYVPESRLFDEFGSISFQKVKPHLDKLAYHLQNSPGSTAAIVSTRKWALSKKAVDYLSSKHDIASGRILFVDKQSKGPMLIKLYIVPPGAVPPN
jgi:hypothetical protein